MLRTVVLTLIVILCLGFYANSWLNRSNKSSRERGDGQFSASVIDQGVISERYRDDYPQQQYNQMSYDASDLSMQQLARGRAAATEQINQMNAETAANMSQRSQPNLLEKQIMDLQQAQNGPSRAELAEQIDNLRRDVEFEQMQSRAAHDMDQIQQNNRPPQPEYRLPW